MQIFLATTTKLVTVSIPDTDVMTPEGFMKTCQQPVVIGTAVTMLVMLPVNIISMFTMFTKVNKMFNPSHQMANQRATRRL